MSLWRGHGQMYVSSLSILPPPIAQSVYGLEWNTSCAVENSNLKNRPWGAVSYAVSTEVLAQGLKQQGHEVDHSAPTSAAVMNKWI